MVTISDIRRPFHHFDYDRLEPSPREPRTVKCLRCGEDYKTWGISHGWCFKCYRMSHTQHGQVAAWWDLAKRLGVPDRNRNGTTELNEAAIEATNLFRR